MALDNGSCQTRTARQAAWAARAAWVHVIPVAQDRPELNPTEGAWRRRTRDARSPLAPPLRRFGDELVVGLRPRGGARVEVVDVVLAWVSAGQRKEPTGRPRGRPTGAKDTYKRAPYRKKCTNVAALT